MRLGRCQVVSKYSQELKGRSSKVGLKVDRKVEDLFEALSYCTDTHENNFYLHV